MRCVIMVDDQGVQVPVGTTEHSVPVVCGVDHKHDAEVALALDVVENLMIAPDSLSVGLNFGKPRQVVPVHLAVRGVRTAWT